MIDKTELEEVEEQEVETIDRNDLTLQQFMNDMSMLGTQVRNPELKKPVFHYGDMSIGNYLLWLILAELMILNNKLCEE